MIRFGQYTGKLSSCFYTLYCGVSRYMIRTRIPSSISRKLYCRHLFCTSLCFLFFFLLIPSKFIFLHSHLFVSALCSNQIYPSRHVVSSTILFRFLIKMTCIDFFSKLHRYHLINDSICH